MSVTQTVEVPASRRLTIDVPREIPAGPVLLTFTPAPEAAPRRMSAREAIEKCRGIAKGSRFTSARLFEDRRRDTALDEAQYRRNFHNDGDAD
jgi:hypothetical protein